MTQAQHTPGPWKIEYIPKEASFSIVSQHRIYSDHNDSNSIARVYGDGELNSANARLAATAPELLEELSDSNARIEAALPLLKEEYPSVYLALFSQWKANNAVIARAIGPQNARQTA